MNLCPPIVKKMVAIKWGVQQYFIPVKIDDHHPFQYSAPQIIGKKELPGWQFDGMFPLISAFRGSFFTGYCTKRG